MKKQLSVLLAVILIPLCIGRVRKMRGEVADYERARLRR